MGARAGKHKLEARTGKYKLRTRAGKYKLGARAGDWGWEPGLGLGVGKYKDLKVGLSPFEEFIYFLQ